MFSSTTIENSRYYDSVVLMRVASQLKKRDGVAEVALFMGTQGNHDLLSQASLATEQSKIAGPEDLIIIVQANSEDLADEISAEAMSMLTTRKNSDEENLDYRPRTLDRALNSLPRASIAAISIPGEYAAREAAKCLDKNLSVFLFSDNVTIEDERMLKKKALSRDLLCMGPDCGTAYLNGVGLGFTNVVRQGRVGCLAASGTGLQAVVCRLDQLGEGVSHCIGVGGRDLSLEIGGEMTRYGLKLLDEDPDTKIIIIISKPPHPNVLRELHTVLNNLQTPVIAYFQGVPVSLPTADIATTLDNAADMAIKYLNKQPFSSQIFEHPSLVIQRLKNAVTDNVRGRIVGLFTGGTLAKEAHILINKVMKKISSDITEREHCIIADLGDDQYTIGKPHPMIAPENRTEVLLEMASKGVLNSCQALLFDVVLGNGSSLDPASELVYGLEQLRKKHGISVQVVAAVIGTEQDPQSLSSQISVLEEIGVTVFLKNSEAARFALMVAEPSYRARILEKIT